MLDDLQYRILKKIAPGEPAMMDGSTYDGESKIDVYLGRELLEMVRDKTVIDFGWRGSCRSRSGALWRNESDWH
jgi:hypothetical protein